MVIGGAIIGHVPRSFLRRMELELELKSCWWKYFIFSDVMFEMLDLSFKCCPLAKTDKLACHARPCPWNFAIKTLMGSAKTSKFVNIFILEVSSYMVFVYVCKQFSNLTKDLI